MADRLAKFIRALAPEAHQRNMYNVRSDNARSPAFRRRRCSRIIPGVPYKRQLRLYLQTRAESADPSSFAGVFQLRRIVRSGFDDEGVIRQISGDLESARSQSVGLRRSNRAVILNYEMAAGFNL